MYLSTIMRKIMFASGGQGPHGMGDLLRPSAIEKASLNEPVRQEMQQSVESYIMHYNSYSNRVSKPLASFLTFLPSHYLTFRPLTH